MTELTRIPDKKQAARVAAKAVKAVEQSEKEAAKNPDAKPMKLSSSTIKRFVDEDLGIKLNPKPKQKNGINLSDYMQSKIGQIEAIVENLSEIPIDAWKLLDESEPGLPVGRSTKDDTGSSIWRGLIRPTSHTAICGTVLMHIPERQRRHICIFSATCSNRESRNHQIRAVRIPSDHNDVERRGLACESQAN